MKSTTLLRSYIEGASLLALPGAHDPLCARILEKTGFRAVFAGGYSNSAAVLGQPDVGLLGRSDMIDAAGRIVDAVEVPVFADADTGYGGPASVQHTVRGFEKAGVAGLFLEDQTSPKRCGHLDGKQVIAPEEMRAKIRAAVDARQDDDFVVMARTDAIAVHGVDDAIERMNSYVAAGADATFVEAPPTRDVMRRVVTDVPAPAMANMVPGGVTPLCGENELAELGFAVVAYPTVATYAITAALRKTFDQLHRTGNIASITDELVDFQDFNDLVGLPNILADDRRYSEEPGQSGP